MSELISGKEAKLAWANGVGVQISHKNETLKKEWHDLYGTLMLSAFDSDIYEFRLKPCTITINGIEVPVCGSNYQEGETIFVFDDCCDERGYIEYSASGHQYQNLIPKLWWRTEEEIKQVVAALRSIFK